MLGGDLRELELAKTLLDYDVDLRLVGFPSYPELKKAERYSNAVEAVSGARFIIAPMSNTDLDGNIVSRLDNHDPIDLTKIIPLLSSNVTLLIGVAKPIITKLANQHQLKVVETSEIDEIAILNSIPTAEGAIQLAMEKLPITLHNSSCLVVGFGRCGITLARALAALGARVSVASRSESQLARAIEMGLTPLLLEQLSSRQDFDVIFNTIPVMVLPKTYLIKLNSETLIIDLAAAPGGVDFLAAAELGIEAILALSLPGKFAPKTAGKILSDCIPRLLNELLGGKEDVI